MTLPIAVTVDRYVVSCLPVDHPEWAMFSLFVVMRRNLNGWVVTDGVANLDAAGKRHYGSVASKADRESYTFPSEVEALDVAARFAPTLSVEGRSVADVVLGLTVPGAHAVSDSSSSRADLAPCGEDAPSTVVSRDSGPAVEGASQLT